MDSFMLDINSLSIGGYLSSEQIDLISIIQCETKEELFDFARNCKQLKGISLNINQIQDLESTKKEIFKMYQDSLVFHDSHLGLENTLKHCNVKEEDIEVIKKNYQIKDSETIEYIKEYIKNRYSNYEQIFTQNFQFVSRERDQLKSEEMYAELSFLASRLSDFDTVNLGSGKFESIYNVFYEKDKSKRFDFYHMKRDLDFAYRNGKHVRYHSLLTKAACEESFEGKSKEEVLQLLSDYVKASVDFISEYNKTHLLSDGNPIINAVDLFNEIVSFDKNNNGLYENIWESKFEITIEELTEVFEYAKNNKPKGVSYLYNEPFLENSERRQKVVETLEQINEISSGLIDTLGSQMHITLRENNEEIADCFKDFKSLQDNGYQIQITEFDMCVGKNDILRTLGEKPEITPEQIYLYKADKIKAISQIIESSGVKLSGLSYWSLTDKTDCNLERIRTDLKKKETIANVNQIPNAFGGLYPTNAPVSLCNKLENQILNGKSQKHHNM